jgi:hypothetical protein
MNTVPLRTAALAAITALYLFTTVAGCQSRKNSVDGQAMSEAQGDSVVLELASASRSGLSGNLTTVMLTDDSLGGMQASAVAVPEGWRAQGRMVANACTNLPFAAWDAVSPDGQSQFNVLPQFGWRLGNGAHSTNGCIPLNETLNAADFLQKFSARLPGDVRVLGPMPIAGAFRQRQENFTNGQNNNNARLGQALQSRNIGDVAAVRAIDASGHEMRLRAWVECNQNSLGGYCFAKVDILRTPKGRLDALVALVDGHNLVQDHPTEEYKAVYTNRQRQVAGQQMEQLRRNAAAGSEMLRQQYLDSSARLNAAHQAGMEELQRSTDSSMRNATNNMNARTTAASDWRDYAADQQTVTGANGTYKTSSQYSNVWSSPVGPALSDGRTFGSTNNTIDPNTATDNDWTKDNKVHGNGQPY